MRIHLLCAGLLLAAAPAARAQTPAPTTPVLALPRFCVVRSSGVLNDAQPSLTADFGRAARKARLPAADRQADDFRQEHLASVPDMLDYMDRAGWELVQTTAVVGGQTSSPTPLLEYQYIFRRKAGQ